MAKQKYWDGGKWVQVAPSMDEFEMHLAEDAIHLATGTANAITVNTGGSYSYAQFKQLRFKAIANSTGNVTINVDGKGAVPGLKFDGTQLVAGAIKAGKIYEWYYDTASGGRFFLIAKASGTAVVGDVLAGKPFSNDDGEQIGAMIDRGAMIFTPTAAQQTIPQGYHNGNGRVNAGALKASGTSSFTNGLLTITGIGFTPSEVYVEFYPGTASAIRISYLNSDPAGTNRAIYGKNPGNNTLTGTILTTSDWSISNGTVNLNNLNGFFGTGSIPFKWTAVA